MNSLSGKQVADTLATLHQKAKADHEDRFKNKTLAAQKGEPFQRSWATAYMAVSPEEGRFLHFLAAASKAKNIVEFGCSFGISTIYLAAAAKDNGGSVITTDIEPNKIAGATQNLESAGLKDLVTLLQGDAIQTLALVNDEIDFLFLDGAKDLYLPVLHLLKPKLRKGAIIFADNADHLEAQPFVKYIKEAVETFTSIDLFDNRVLLAYYL